MRLSLSYARGELLEKRNALLQAMSERVADEDPDLAHHLYKAMAPPNVRPRQRGLQALQDEFRQGYASAMEDARKRIAAVLSAPDSELKE